MSEEQEGKTIIIYNTIVMGAQTTGGVTSASDKSRTVALVLCILLGWLGIHRFYVGKAGTGVLWLFTGGMVGIGWLVDLIMIISGAFRDADNRRVSKW